MSQSRQAERIIAKFGGARPLAAAIGKDPATVYRWTYPRAKGGTDGLVPTACALAVKAAAEIHGYTLTAEDWQP